MTDRTPTGKRQDTDRDGLSVAEAADQLGLTPDAVRARLHRGTLGGEKHAGTWRVWLSTTTTDRQTTGDRQDPTGHRQDAPTGDTGVDLGPLAELIARQGDEIGRLRETTAVWQIRAMQAEERLKQLTAGETPESPPQTGATAAPEGQGATIRSARGQPPGAWWRRWLGLTR
jgi:hypothetical protein